MYGQVSEELVLAIRASGRRIPEWLRVLLAMLIFCRVRADGGEVWLRAQMTQKKLAEMAGVDTRQVQRALAELREEGLIELLCRGRRGSAGSEYRVGPKMEISSDILRTTRQNERTTRQNERTVRHRGVSEQAFCDVERRKRLITERRANEGAHDGEDFRNQGRYEDGASSSWAGSWR